MGKHPLIFWLVIKIDKETFIDLYLGIYFIAVWILLLVFIVLLDKANTFTFTTYLEKVREKNINQAW